MAGDDEGILRSDTLFYNYDTTQKVTTVEAGCQVVKCIVGIMKNYDLSLKGKGVFFLTTLLEFKNSLLDILIYLFAKIHRSSIDLVIKHLTRVNGNKVCRKKIDYFLFFCPQLQLFGFSDPHVYSQNTLQLLRGKNKRFLFFCDCEYVYGSAWKWLLYSDYVLLRPSLFVVFPHLF